jgi:hypothetical protein
VTPRADDRHRRPAKALWALPALLSLILLPGCGKKGPPLAPLVRVPARADRFEARRLGATVYLQVRIPDRNQDGSSPADISRLEIYGFTGDPPSIADVIKHGTLVASLPVRRPPEPEPPPRRGQPAPAPAKKPAAAKTEPGFDQGALAVVTEALTRALLKPVVLPPVGRPGIPLKSTVTPPLVGPPYGRVPGRTYAVVGYSRSGKKGTPSGPVAVPLVQAPQPPTTLVLAYTSDRFTLTWQPPATVRHRVQEQAAAGMLSAVPLIENLPASTYNVYEVDPAPAGSTAAPAPASIHMPAPVNSTPLEVSGFEDPRFAFGVERCYVVRTVDTFGSGLVVASEASRAACVTPKDTFAPAAPKGLQAVPGSGTISLIWESNTEADLAGYLVLRSVAPSGTFERLTPDPIRETTHNDTTAKSGVRYRYAIVAVDTAVPFNTSPLSNAVEVVAR